MSDVYRRMDFNELNKPIIVPSGVHVKQSIGLHFATILILFGMMVGASYLANLIYHWGK